MISIRNLCSAILLFASVAQAQSIFTVAGGGTDDGRPATLVALNQPTAVAIDPAGNLVIADASNNRVRRLNVANGSITTVAGNGTAGFSGDGGPATAAGLFLPYGVVLDPAGNLYVADYLNHRVRKVAASGTIATIAGNGSSVYSGDGGPATSAGLVNPFGIALDSAGNVYVSDYWDNRIRKIAAGTGTITTFAGRGGGGFSGDGGAASSASLLRPAGLAVDASGNVYFADAGNNRIRRVAAATGIITTFAGTGLSGFSGDGGAASAAALSSPHGVAIDAAGNAYIADSGNHRIRKVDAAGNIATIGGNGTAGFSGDNGPATAAALNQPAGVAIDPSGSLYIADYFNNRIRRLVLSTGVITTVAGSGKASVGDGGPATAAILAQCSAVATDSTGNYYIADTGNNRIRRVAPDTRLITTIAGNGQAGFSGDNGPAADASLKSPAGVAPDSTGNVYVADTGNNRVRMIAAATGTITTVAGNGTASFAGDGGPGAAASLNGPNGIALDRSGNLYIADTLNNRIRVVTPAGTITTFAGNGTAGFLGDGGPAVNASLAKPAGVAVDAYGNVFIADTYNNRIRRVAFGTGVITTVAGSGIAGFSGDGGSATTAALKYPQAVALDASAANLYIADYWNYRIRRVAVGSGIITTAAGTSTAGFTGDGGPATSAGLAQPAGVALDNTGNIYIADSMSNRIRAIFACTTVLVPVLTVPPNGATAVASAPTLTWNQVKGAFRYDVYLSTSNPPLLMATDLTATTFVPSNLAAGATFFWKVVAKGDPFCTQQSTAASEIRSFTTAGACAPPANFDVTQPANGQTGVPSSVQLSWQTAAGATTYDLYLSASNPPALYSRNLTAATAAAANLAPNATYYWYVAAHSSCDATKTVTTPTRSFTTAGACATAGSFTLLSPANASSNIGSAVTLTWSASALASSYDVYLGTTSPPPLYLADLRASTVSVSGLTPAQSYFWRVVAKVACDASRNVSSSTFSFSTANVCTAPPATSITFVPQGNVGVGQTYTVAWQSLPELGADGYYLIERSTTQSFSTIVDAQQSFSTSASFISSTAGTYFHRVRGVMTCDASHPGPVSSVKSVNVVAGTANVIFTVQPRAVITSLGDKLEDQSATFTLENLGTTPLQVIIGKAEINSPYFFTWRDRLGGDPVFVTLAPRTPRSFDILFSGPPNDQSGTFQGVIFVASTGQGLAITPYAFVSLKVGGGTTTQPTFVSGGTPTDYAFFPGFSGDDANRPAITIDISNTGTTPMELGAEIGPELWLVPEPGWNASPIPAGASRSVRLKTQRSRAPNGSALPRYSYFTVRSKSGGTARLLVQDNDALPTAVGRTSLLDPGSRSFIIPGVVSASPQISRIRLTNVESDSVQADLFFTPLATDGFDARSVKRATIVIPPNDVVTLTDPLVQVLGIAPPARGQIEVRTAPEKAGFLVVSSTVMTAQAGGGAFSYEMPSLVLGEGARLGHPHTIAGVMQTSATHTSLVLAETSGVEAMQVRAILYDGQGSRKGDRLLSVTRYGQTNVDDVVTALGGTEPFDGGRIDMNVESGGGSVVGVITVLDAKNGNGAVLVSQPSTSSVAGTSLALLQRARLRTSSATSASAVAPFVVNGTNSNGATQRTTMGFVAAPGATGTTVVTYQPSDPAAAPISKSLPLPSNVVLQFDNVLEDLFGLPKGQSATGAVFVSAGAGAQIYARLMTLHGTTWSITAGLPVLPTLSDAVTSVASKRPVYLDGIEQSIDPSRGTRWDVIINEIAGGSGSILVRLYEAGNRSVPIAEKTYPIASRQQLKLSSIFAAMGLDSDDRRKDRTNVLCALSPESGNAAFSAAALSTDNKTGDVRLFTFSPTGGVPSTGVLRISTVTAVQPPAATGRKRVVRQ